MLRNFFTTASRNIRKYKAYSIINFIGLTAGLTLSLLIISYVRSELSFDQFHEKIDRLYRIAYTAPNGLRIASSPPPIAPLMTEFFPEVEAAARVFGRNVSISHGEGSDIEAFEENGVFFVDSALMKMMTFTFVSGNPKRAMVDPFTILLTEAMATKYFGNKNPIGESLLFGGRVSFKVVGVVKTFPENSHWHFNILVPYENMFDLETPLTEERMRTNLATNFVISHSYTFVLLKPGASPKGVDDNMQAFLKKYCPPNRQVGQIFTLFPVKDIHMQSTLLAEPSSTNSMTNIYIFIGIGILTLLIACINYINLATAQSFTRIKEIGIRKILGSAKSQLIVQFLAESFLFCLVAIVLSYGAFYLALPLLNQFTGKELEFSNAIDTILIISSLLLLIVIVLLAGGYPAWFVAQFDSVTSIKGSGGSQKEGGHFLRRSLVVFQLMIACMLLSGSLMLVKQLNYLADRPLGFQKELMITIPLYSANLNSLFSRVDSSFRNRLQTFRDRVEALADVEKTAAGSNAPGLGTFYRGTIPEGFTSEDNMFIANLVVDYNYIPTYDIKVVAGRPFSRDYGTDEAEGFMVNETAVREFKWDTPEQAIGKTIDREGKKGKVIGVVGDFVTTSLTTPMNALVMEMNVNQWNSLTIRFRNQNVTSNIEKIQSEWEMLFPEKTFQYGFLDETLNNQYASFRNFSSIIQSFTGIAILISCLGVYGLVLFVVRRKVKEIGVRKVMGASVANVLQLIYTDFFWLLLIGFVLAVPVSYYFIAKWLENFTYHTDIDILTFVISFALVVIIVALTISYQAIKASLANPVHSLRSE